MLLQSESMVSSLSSTDDFDFTPIINAIKAINEIPEFIHTLYLFTANDFATFAIPTILFATFGSLSGTLLTTNPSVSLLSVLTRIPLALIVVWANLLIFNISNQRSPVAVEEDKINKPHRPLPSGLITQQGARRALLVLVPTVLLLSWMLNVVEETLFLFTSTWLYNDLGGSDENWVLRNLLIAIGYGIYSSAALHTMVGSEYTLSMTGIQWVLLITAVMFTTQHICDIKDAEGDRTRGRRSAPIVLGDDLVRWSVAVPILISSVACPAFFSLGPASYITTLAIGGLVAYRTLTLRDLDSDKLTWKLWALWTCGLFVLPLVSNPTVCAEAWRAVRSIFCQDGECFDSLNIAAVSGVALVVEAKRAVTQMGALDQENGTIGIHDIKVEGVTVG